MAPRVKRKRATLEQRTRRVAAAATKRAEAERRRRQAQLVEAQRQERIAENAAPAAVRKPVVQTAIDRNTGAVSETVLRGPLVEVIAGRPTRINQVAAVVGQSGELPVDFHDVIGKLGRESRIISLGHLVAARRLQADWTEIGAGFGIGASDYAERTVRGGSGGVSEARHWDMLSQIGARARLDGAILWLGALAQVVVAVVLNNVPVSAWARANAMGDKHAVGYLAAALTRLVGFYAQPHQRVMVAFEAAMAALEPSDGIRSMVAEDVAARRPALGTPADGDGL